MHTNAEVNISSRRKSAIYTGKSQRRMENIDTVARCFQKRFMGQMGLTKFVKVVKLFFLRKPDTAPKKGIRKKPQSGTIFVFD